MQFENLSSIVEVDSAIESIHEPDRQDKNSISFSERDIKESEDIKLSCMVVPSESNLSELRQDYQMFLN